MTNKTHYRKVFKSDHLSTADLEDFTESGSNLIFTIKNVRQESGAKVAGRKINANIAYFSEKIKPMVLNAGNSKALKTLTNSPFVEDWQNITVQLYIDPTAAIKGEVVGGVRISDKPVRLEKPTIQRGSKQFDMAVIAFKRDGNFNAVIQRANISQEDMRFIDESVNNGSL